MSVGDGARWSKNHESPAVPKHGFMKARVSNVLNNDTAFCPSENNDPAFCPGENNDPAFCPGENNDPAFCPGENKGPRESWGHEN